MAHGSPAAVLREPAPIFASAAHAEQRAHLEAAGNATYPRCPACVLRIQALGCPAARSDSTRAAAHGAAILLVRGLPPSAPVPLLAAPRGPPLL